MIHTFCLYDEKHVDLCIMFKFFHVWPWRRQNFCIFDTGTCITATPLGIGTSTCEHIQNIPLGKTLTDHNFCISDTGAFNTATPLGLAEACMNTFKTFTWVTHRRVTVRRRHILPCFRKIWDGRNIRTHVIGLLWRILESKSGSRKSWMDSTYVHAPYVCVS